ncbi:uncharacterized protein METZ01_LOCUS475880, partial [marine metagenome]
MCSYVRPQELGWSRAGTPLGGGIRRPCRLGDNLPSPNRHKKPQPHYRSARLIHFILFVSLHQISVECFLREPN